jgi:hypothetical protein
MNINWKYLTTGVLVATTIILSGYDIAAAMSSGEDATISQVILHAAQRVPASVGISSGPRKNSGYNSLQFAKP